ncbi:hypothetical protein CFP65_0652 [Kitasatospora sp. MMS16-BH015]|uniref:DUF2306 domain-containing protein n=1 Tax=Kitasatospora sp. MMS16-BH015 TaxID=2018025 RepID=UPI000CA17794|nr:DUF2306 domain-containing protein [Kitasatospora sp. MMS16-BH015]AUG75606.1 hypothetical protein CFP65_0652 [Kitasatospora sp. MMS16-BH015]
MNRPSRARWTRIAAVTITAVCVGYAPIAMTDIWPYADPQAPAIGQWLLARAVSARYMADALATRTGPYAHSLAALVVHTVLGGLLMLLGPAQLFTAVRRRLRLHRALGVVYALTVLVSMGGAAVYLARTAPKDAFGGEAFWIVLATILVGTVLSTLLGVLAAIGRLPAAHQRWMLLCYGYLMTAPLLRIEWMVLPWFFPGQSMTAINRIALTHLGSLVAFGALLGSRALDRRAKVPGAEGSWAPVPVVVGAQLAGVAGIAWLGVELVGSGAEGRQQFLGYVVPYVACALVMVWRRAVAGREGRAWAREEWGVHLTAMGLAPVFSAGAALVFQHALGVDELTALTAGVGIGCGMLAFFATAVVAVRLMYAREVVRRRPAAETVTLAGSAVVPAA